MPSPRGGPPGYRWPGGEAPPGPWHPVFGLSPQHPVVSEWALLTYMTGEDSEAGRGMSHSSEDEASIWTQGLALKPLGRGGCEPMTSHAALPLRHLVGTAHACWAALGPRTCRWGKGNTGDLFSKALGHSFIRQTSAEPLLKARQTLCLGWALRRRCGRDRWAWARSQLCLSPVMWPSQVTCLLVPQFPRL